LPLTVSGESDLNRQNRLAVLCGNGILRPNLFTGQAMSGRAGRNPAPFSILMPKGRQQIDHVKLLRKDGKHSLKASDSLDVIDEVRSAAVDVLKKPMGWRMTGIDLIAQILTAARPEYWICVVPRYSATALAK